ncbi:MAG: UDP-3-O-(3-hydroxymyristoyl)glucosamine N-acyltransferase [Desulfobacterales bacterium]|nr:UDP-3-O-(3-hydroxymyristoyl)glucosamine N-acyltransferase [Desulfobacterales bacterium]
MVTAQQIAEMINAQVYGDQGVEISGASSFDDAGPKDLTFAVDHSYLSRLSQCSAGLVIVPSDYIPSDQCNTPLLKSDNPKLSFFKVVEYLFPKEQLCEFIHPSAVIGPNCLIGEGTRIDANATIEKNTVIGDHVHIMANAYIGADCQIGDHSEIKPNATLMEKSRLGKNVIIHSGAVIGSDGYGFTQDNGNHAKIVHTGYVEIGNDVEIGACTTIDRGTLGITRIGNGVKTDNLVHIAHNVKIGDNTLVVGQVGIAGSTQIGKNVILAGKAGISGHLKIGDGAIVGPYAGVSKDVPANEIVSGIPHMPHKTWLKVANIISRLPGMRTKLLSLEKRLKLLEGKTTE